MPADTVENEPSTAGEVMAVRCQSMNIAQKLFKQTHEFVGLGRRDDGHTDGPLPDDSREPL